MHKTLTRAVAAAGALLACGAATATYAYAYTPAPQTSERGVLVVYAHLPDGLAPGATVPVTYTADNLSDFAVRVGMITSSVSVDEQHAAGCPSSYFTVRPHASNTDVPGGAKGAALGASTVTFANSTHNQNGCQGATLSVRITSN